MTKTPKPHQQEAIAKGVEHFSLFDRGQLIMACGTGKTLTSLWIAQQLGAKQLIVALPSLQLQEQTVGTWISQLLDLNYRILVVGSDTSINKIYRVPVTTNQAEIVEFLKDSTPKIVFTTYQSNQVLSDACMEVGMVFDFGIVDEAHETAGHELKKFGRILNDQNGIVIRKRLFMTATPRFFESEKVVSMDNNEVYGEAFFRLTTENAIKDGILCDYKLLVIWLNDQDLLRYANKQKLLSLDKVTQIPNRYVALLQFLEKAVNQYRLKRIVSFHKTVELAANFAKLIKQNSESIASFTLNNTVSVGQRLSILEQYKQSPVSIITNPKVLMQGYDMPEIDAILFADLRKSQFEVNQAIGRCLRRHESKEVGYVLFPIFVNEKGVYNKDEYDLIAKALSSVAAYDTRISMEIHQRTREKKATEDLVHHINLTKLDTEKIEQLRQSLSVRVWNRAKAVHYVSFDEFVQIARTVGLPMGVNSRESYTSWVSGSEKYTTKCPITMPQTPESVFADSWQGWDWLFNKRGKNNIMPYIEAKKVAQNACERFGICSVGKLSDWKYGKLSIAGLPPFPPRMAVSPEKSYRDEFEGWDVFFGRNEKVEFVSYQETVDWVRSQGITNRETFYRVPRPPFITSTPERIHKDQWQGWDAFFGKPKSKKIAFLPYEQAKEWVNKNLVPLGINSFGKWHDWLRGEYPKAPLRPPEIRSNPTVYKEFEGWDTFFNKKAYYLKKRN